MILLDVDECSRDEDECDQNCLNTVGSYTCSCNTGYILNSDGLRCDGECIFTRALQSTIHASCALSCVAIDILTLLHARVCTCRHVINRLQETWM